MKVSAISQALLGLSTTVGASRIEYSTVTGYFLQDESSTDPSTFDYVCPVDLGKQWRRRLTCSGL